MNYSRQTKGLICLLWLAVLGVLGLGSSERLWSQEISNHLVVLYTHDLHSNLESYAVPSSGQTAEIAGGYARIATAIKAEQEGNAGNVLVLDAGDFSMGALFHVLRSQYAPELVTMGTMGFDAVTFGNHDFEYGYDSLADTLLAAKAHSDGKLPSIVASNTVIPHDLPELEHFRRAYAAYPVLPYTIVERAGLQIGIFGLMGRDAAVYCPQAYPVEFSDYREAARNTVAQLRKEGAQMVICLSHCGTWQDKSLSEDEMLADNVPGIDLIISGHTHTCLNAYLQVGNTAIVSCGAYGRYLGRVELVSKPQDGFKVSDYRLLPVTQALAPDPRVDKLIAFYAQKAEHEYLAKFNYRFQQTLAYNPFNLGYPDWNKGERAKCEVSGLGPLITDAFIYAVKKAEGKNYREITFAVEPYGQIRTPLAKGNLTVNDAFRVLSLGVGPDKLPGYSLVTFYLTGADIRQLLEIETTLGPVNDNARLQVSGIKFSYDFNDLPFSRIQQAEILKPNGSTAPLEDEKLYRICTNWNMYLMADYLKKKTGGLVDLSPRNEKGEVIQDLLYTRVLLDPQTGTELKEWCALALYLQSFAPKAKGGLPVIPERYRKPQDPIREIR